MQKKQIKKFCIRKKIFWGKSSSKIFICVLFNFLLDRAERHPFNHDFCYSFFSFLLFRREDKRGENDQNLGKKSCFSARSFYWCCKKSVYCIILYKSKVCSSNDLCFLLFPIRINLTLEKVTKWCKKSTFYNSLVLYNYCAFNIKMTNLEILPYFEKYFHTLHL